MTTIVQTIHEVPKNALYAAKQGNGTYLCYFEADRVSLPASVYPPDPGPSRDEIDAEAARTYAKLKALIGMTPAQVQTWVAANVTNLAQAQDAIATLAVAVSVLARRL